jgi:hypothetical protein
MGHVRQFPFCKPPFADGTVGSVSVNRRLLKRRFRVTNTVNCLSYFLLSPNSSLLLSADGFPNYLFACPRPGMDFRHPARSLLIKPLISRSATVSKVRHSSSGLVATRSDLVLSSWSGISLSYIRVCPDTRDSCIVLCTVSFVTDWWHSPTTLSLIW